MAVKTVTIEKMPILTPKRERNVRNLSPFSDPYAKDILSNISLRITVIFLYNRIIAPFN